MGHAKGSIIETSWSGVEESTSSILFSLDIWDPFKDFPLSSSLSTEFSRENSAFLHTLVDWKETPEAHLFKADIPGLKKEEVKVEVEDNRVLQISGERNVEKEDKNDKWHSIEHSIRKFKRRFSLPENVKMDQIKANLENGVLIVTVPKEEIKSLRLRPLKYLVRKSVINVFWV
ncbi:hypothetical protein L6164_036514 [Bauhinia variegata]|uniref:Uncharacterized protein n=1 Tax=Bauhinia variegata TaxID=167791 RepID=A0ACB9KHA3_BAUVA|nr:hypothetical protein L6164_036514 [Bauhinia variegata]